MSPCSSPTDSCSTLTSGARQFVVQDAFEMTRSDALRLWWLTPYTIVGRSLPAGAEISTRPAPASRCADAFSFEAKKPVHSNTTSTPRLFHGSFAGSRSCTTRIRSPATTRSEPSTDTGNGTGPWAEPYRVRWAFVCASGSEERRGGQD